MSQKLEHSAETTSDSSEADAITMTLWTRRPVCGARTTTLDRMVGLRTAGIIDDFDVETWPEELVLGDADGEVATVVERFESWATERGLSLRPPFETRTVSPLVGESKRVLTLPMMTLAVFDDGLAGVYPCSDGDRTWTVSDYLDACEQAGTVLHYDSEAFPG